ncbi:MAG: hypothetical protein ABI910_18790 [Gemmatimonadota bacterium]
MTRPDPSHKAAAASAQARQSGGSAPDGVERRTNPRLRELIDEMLVTVRVAVNRELWTPEERASTETELNAIMGRIRSQAIPKLH